MGRLILEDMISQTDRDTALQWHLTCNCYPPIPARMFAVARVALRLANQGKWDKPVHLPAGMAYRDGGNTATVTQIVRTLHLEAFLDRCDS